MAITTFKRCKPMNELTIEETTYTLTDKEAEHLMLQLWNSYQNPPGYKGSRKVINEHYYLGGIEDREALEEAINQTPVEEEVAQKIDGELPSPPDTRDPRELLVWFAQLAEVDKESVHILLHKMSNPDITLRQLEQKIGKGRTVISERIQYMAKCNTGIARLLGYTTKRSRAQRRRRKQETRQRAKPVKRKASKRTYKPFE